MTNLHKTTTALMLAAALLLTGCAKQYNNHTSTEISNSGSDISDPFNSANSEEYSETDPSSSNTSADNSDISKSLTPLSFTEEDKELQEILNDLMANGAGTAYYWFTGFSLGTDAVEQKIRITNNQTSEKEYIYFLIPEKYQDNNLTVPITYAEMENTIGRFFTMQATEKYMEHIFKGTVTGGSDGVLNVALNGEYDNVLPLFLEADGHMYRLDTLGTNILNMDGSTARITAKEDGIIEFTYLPYCYEYQQNTEFAYEETYSAYAQAGYIVLEDGIWKLPYWGYGGFERR